MSQKLQEIIWSVEDYQEGIPIGYSVEFSPNSLFQPVTFKFSTCESPTAGSATFYYSLDAGITWIAYPINVQGVEFSSSYKMKLVVPTSVSKYIFAEKKGTIYRIRADNSEIIDSYEIDSFNNSDFSSHILNDTVYVSGQEKTLYAIDTYDELSAGKSLDIHTNPLAICVDGTRQSFWQIDRSNVSLKDMSDGRVLANYALPFDIDVDFSSSSSSSSSSLSSLSSLSSSSLSSSSESSSSVSSESSSSVSSSSESSSSYSSASSSIDSSSSSSSSGSSSSSSSLSSSSSGGFPSDTLFWLDANSATMQSAYNNNDVVDVYYDVSGNVNNFVSSLTGGIYKTGVLNALPVVRCQTSTWNYGYYYKNLSLYTYQYSIFYVFIVNKLYNGRLFLSDSSTLSLDILVTSMSRLQIMSASDVVANTSISIGTPYILSVVQDASQVRAYLNSSDITWHSMVNLVLLGGAQISPEPPANPVNADVAEIMFYSRGVNSGERTSIESYLSAKWGIP